MKKSALDNMERIIKYMGEVGWKDKAAMMSLLDAERKDFLAALSQAFLDITVESFNVAEAKFIGYVELVKNRDKPDTLDSILKSQTQLIGEKEAKRKEIEYRISELFFLLEDFRDRILETGNLPQTVPANNSTNNLPEDNCA